MSNRTEETFMLRDGTALFPDEASPAPAPYPSRGTGIGMLAAWRDRLPLVDYHGNPREGLLPARSVVPFGDLRLGAEVLLWFEGGNPCRPIIVGMLQSPPEDAPPGAPGILRFEAEREISLACGKSSLTMDRDGRIVLRGVEVTSRASRTNKIKGGTVLLN
jgi:hypothetical protein